MKEKIIKEENKPLEGKQIEFWRNCFRDKIYDELGENLAVKVCVLAGDILNDKIDKITPETIKKTLEHDTHDFHLKGEDRKIAKEYMIEKYNAALKINAKIGKQKDL